MNNKRRKEVAKILVVLQNEQSKLEGIQNEEHDAFYNMPYGLRESDKGQAAEEALSHLDDAVSSLNEVIDQLSTI